MNFKQLIICIAVILLAISELLSQTRQSSGGPDSLEIVINEDVRIIELTFDAVLPYSGFKRSLNKNLVGFTAAYYAQSNSKQYAHLGLLFSLYRIDELSNTILNGFDQFMDTTTSSAFMARFIYRQYAPFYYKGLEPFVEASVGPHVFYTSTNTIFLDAQGGSSFTFDESDLGLSYGVAVGSTIYVIENILGVVKFGFHGGTSTSFLVAERGLTTLYPIDSFITQVDRVGYFSINLGLEYTF
jgi:hypothetical protein